MDVNTEATNSGHLDIRNITECIRVRTLILR